MADFKQSDIIETLRIYDQSGSISAAARELGVKRETVRRRLRYAKEVNDIIASAVPGAEALKRRAVYSV